MPLRASAFSYHLQENIHPRILAWSLHIHAFCVFETLKGFLILPHSKPITSMTGQKSHTVFKYTSNDMGVTFPGGDPTLLGRVYECDHVGEANHNHVWVWGTFCEPNGFPRQLISKGKLSQTPISNQMNILSVGSVYVAVFGCDTRLNFSSQSIIWEQSARTGRSTKAAGQVGGQRRDAYEMLPISWDFRVSTFPPDIGEPNGLILFMG